MSELLTPLAAIDDDDDVIEVPDATNHITEDDTPVDLFCEREMSLLAGSADTSFPRLLNERRFIVLANWLRWCDREGNILLTGQELADLERQRAEEERQRTERLAAQLRALGIDPEA